MPERIRDRGTRRGRQHMTALADELRRARLAAGLTQSTVAAAAGMSRAEVSRIERQQAPWLDIVTAAELCAIVGLDLWLRTYAATDPLRDTGQVKLLGRFLECVHPSLRVRTEVPIGRIGDQRAWDATIGDGSEAIGIEAETRLTDAQALDRRIALKRRDGAIDRVVVVFADTRANRTALRAALPLLRVNLPCGSEEVLAALSAGRLPPAGGVVVM